MRIVHLCLANHYIEGYEYQENILPRKHKQLGYEVSIIASQYCFDKNMNEYERPVDSYLNTDQIQVTVMPYDLRFGKFARMFRIYNGLYDMLQNIQPDIIFCHGTQFFSIGELTKYKKKHPQVKIFSDQHGDYINTDVTRFRRRIFLHRFLWGHMVREAAKISEVIWGVTPLRVTFLQDIYRVPAKKTALLVMGGDDDKIDFANQRDIRAGLREKHNIAQDDFLIVTGGKIGKAKQIDLLMEAVAKINEPKIKLLVFGQPSADMKIVFDTLSNHASIRYIGWIPSDETYNWFLASDLAVFPGTHSVLWEQACACGIPCVFKYWAGMTHVDVGGNCRFLHENSMEEIKRTILELYRDTDSYRKMKKIATERGIPEFSYEQIARRSIQYEEHGGNDR
ncbi:MAG: glycosyltransferase family 4 protein [Clostridiaceae bacterium]|nr:glycosyltransferase family 4 protein [Clostridiaceae bacterium]